MTDKNYPKKKASKFGPKPKIKVVKRSSVGVPKVTRKSPNFIFSTVRSQQSALGKIQLKAAKIAGNQARAAAKKRGITDVKKLTKIRNDAADKAQTDVTRRIKKDWAKAVKIPAARAPWEIKRAKRAKAKKKK